MSLEFHDLLSRGYFPKQKAPGQSVHLDRSKKRVAMTTDRPGPSGSRSIEPVLRCLLSPIPASLPPHALVGFNSPGSEPNSVSGLDPGIGSDGGACGRSERGAVHAYATRSVGSERSQMARDLSVV